MGQWCEVRLQAGTFDTAALLCSAGVCRTFGRCEFCLHQANGPHSWGLARKQLHSRLTDKALLSPGDGAEVTIGDNTNLQDGVIVNTGPTDLEHTKAETIIGNSVTVGHSAALYGVTLEDKCLVGMGATLHSGVKVRSECLPASVTTLMVVPSSWQSFA